MAGASEIRRFRLFAGLLLSLAMLLAVLALSAQPAQAATRSVKGGEARLHVNFITFFKMIGDGIWVTEVPPARIEYGRHPAAIFPVRGVGVVDPALKLGAVSTDGGLRMRKEKIQQTLEVWNITATCAPLAGCRLLATANGAIPNEFAELHNVSITDNGSGTVTLYGVARIGPVGALALNTLFQTTIFTPGFELGEWVSTVNY